MSVLHSDGSIGEPIAPDNSLPFLRLAFRPLFLLGSIFSIICLGLWGAQFSGWVEISPYGGALWWHTHEMLFGFVAAIVAGFLLTAVQTWTGVPGIKGSWLGLLVGLWLAGRVVLFFGSELPGFLLMLVDVSFLPAVAAVLARSVIRVRQWRNIIFVPVLLLMTLANLLMHWSVMAGEPLLQARASEAMVFLVTLLMTVVGGRVIPMFTANGTGTPRVPDLVWLERASITSMALAVAAVLIQPVLPQAVVLSLVLLAALVHGYRVLRWRTWVTFGTPLVWSLHLSYWCIPLGLLLYALVPLVPSLTHSQAIHTLTVGAMGLMILAMISRVSLGHTGRLIQVGGLMAFAFGALYAAFLVRVFGTLLGVGYAQMIQFAALLWVVAYSCFVARYFQALTRPRTDGRPG